MKNMGISCEQVSHSLERHCGMSVTDRIIGPRELSVLSPAAIPLIYGPNTECLKGMFYTQGGHDPDKVAINMMRDVKGHKMRRRAWDRGLSNKGTHRKMLDRSGLRESSRYYVRAACKGEDRSIHRTAEEQCREADGHRKVVDIFRF